LDRSRRHRPIPCLLLALAAALGGCAGDGEPEKEGVRSVVLVTIDTLRADRLSSYGHWRETSPSLDAFLDRGARFEYAFSTSSLTAPSHVSLMTGLYPEYTSVGTDNRKYSLIEETTTLAEICRDAGMRTGAVVSNFVLHRGLGLDQGFESYDDDLTDREMNRDVPEQIAENTVEKSLAKIEEFGDDPFFLWVHFQDPHGPYAPPDPWIRRFPDGDRDGNPGKNLQAGFSQDGLGVIPKYQVYDDERRFDQYVRRYDGEIAYLDSQLASLFDRLEGSGRLRDTLVVVTADHGEALGEEGYYFTHGHSLGLDQTRVPLGFVGPGIAPRLVFRHPVSNISVFATILNALGMSEASKVEQSDSLWPFLLQGRDPQDGIGFASSRDQDAAFESGVYLRWQHGGDRRRLPSPDRLSRGLPGERVDPLGSDEGGIDPARIESLRTKLVEFSESSREVRLRMAAKRGPARAMSVEEEAKLRALGYVK
jgi:arylsulfatase